MKIALTAFFLMITVNLFSQLKIKPYRLGITVSNIDSASKWYEKNLGFKVYKQMQFPEYDSLKIFLLKNENFEIEMMQKTTSFNIKSIKPDYDISTAPLRGYFKFGFKTDKVQETFDKLKRNAVKVIFEPTYDKEFDQRFFIIEDLDGNFLQFSGPKNS